MKKLRLDPESLEVDAFETTPAGAARGTVAGQAAATIIWPATLTCTRVEDATCYEDCTTQGEDLSCRPTCETMTINAITCPECPPPPPPPPGEPGDTVAVAMI